MKRTMHGEKLQERPGGCYVGLIQKRRWFTREAWCPVCGALPQRKCQPTADDRVKGWGMRGKNLIGDHRERTERAEFLTRLSNQNGGAVLTLAWKPDDRPVEQRTVASLPLFQGVTP